jgi:dATP pyrophosphohydrolase
MQYKRPESVLVLIQDQSGRILVMQRDDDAEFWQSVTGTIEEGEIPLQTAYREVLEETGLDLKMLGCEVIDCRTVNQYKIREDWRKRYPPGTLYNNEYVFRVLVPNDSVILLTEHTDYTWLSAQDAIEKVWSETNKLAIKNFAKSVS